MSQLIDFNLDIYNCFKNLSDENLSDENLSDENFLINNNVVYSLKSFYKKFLQFDYFTFRKKNNIILLIQQNQNDSVKVIYYRKELWRYENAVIQQPR